MTGGVLYIIPHYPHMFRFDGVINCISESAAYILHRETVFELRVVAGLEFDVEEILLKEIKQIFFFHRILSRLLPFDFIGFFGVCPDTTPTSVRADVGFLLKRRTKEVRILKKSAIYSVSCESSVSKR